MSTSKKVIKALKDAGNKGLTASELAKKVGSGAKDLNGAGHDYIYHAKKDKPELKSKISRQYFDEEEEYRYILTDYDKGELYDAIAETSEILKKDIKPKEGKEVLLDQDENALIVIMSDLHLGHEYACYKEIKEAAKLINQYDNVYIIGLGDLIDNSANAHAPSGVMNLMGKSGQTDMIEHIFEILGGNVLILYTGNHEYRSKSSDDMLLNKFWSLKYDASFGYFAQPFIIKIGDKNWEWFCRHKAKGRSKYNPLHQCANSVIFDGAEYARDADIIVTAHTHEPGYGSWNVGGKRRYMLSCSAMVDFDEYAERKGYVSGIDTKMPAIYLTEDDEPEMFLDFKNAIDKYEEELK